MAFDFDGSFQASLRVTLEQLDMQQTQSHMRVQLRLYGCRKCRPGAYLLQKVLRWSWEDCGWEQQLFAQDIATSLLKVGT
jgi:hypothetical protein